MVKLGEKNLKKYIKKIGLYNSKAKNIILLSKKLIKQYNNKIPKEFNELISYQELVIKLQVFIRILY